MNHPSRFVPVLLAACASLASPASAQCEVASVAPYGSVIEHEVGTSVAVSGDLALVGARKTAILVEAEVFVMERQGTAWVEIATLSSSVLPAFDRFGSPVHLEDGIALVGSSSFTQGDAGGLYVFEQQGTAWVETARLTSTPFDVTSTFANALDRSGDVIVAGAPGEGEAAVDAGVVHFFERVGTDWLETAKRTASDADAHDNFGAAVAVEGDFALVGASHDDDSGSDSGAVYVFERLGSGWTEVEKLTASDADALDNFGWDVALSGDRALVGAFWDEPTGVRSGSAYVFERNQSGWVETAKLTASDGAADALFGSSVRLAGDTALVGAPGHAGLGAVYRFERTGASWVESGKLTGASAGALFGQSVALDGDAAVVGAPLADSAFLFSLGGIEGEPLSSCPGTISLAKGGPQRLTLDAAAPLGGNLYWVFGSATGTSPGVGVGGFVLPLNPDEYTLITATYPNTALHVDTLGFLGAGGGGLAVLELPPGLDPALAGSTLHHAYVTLAPGSFAVTSASNAAPVTLGL